jgi:hypothetical protein
MARFLLFLFLVLGLLMSIGCAINEKHRPISRPDDIVIMSQDPTNTNGYAMVSGQIYSKDLWPMSEVSIIVLNWDNGEFLSSTTDEYGFFSISNIPAGTSYSLAVQTDDYCNLSKPYLCFEKDLQYFFTITLPCYGPYTIIDGDGTSDYYEDIPYSWNPIVPRTR